MEETEMNTPTLRELQLFEFQMLKDVVKVCEENDIDYILACGSLLGAVRHGGFIPWDDDIDLYMTPKNYKRFLKIGQRELGDRYFVQNWKTEKNYPFLWTQIRANGTTSMPKKYSRVNMHWGICIDIFPVVGYYESGFRKKIQNMTFGLSQSLLSKEFAEAMNERISGKQRFINALPYTLRRVICFIIQPFYMVDPSSCKKACVLWYIISDFFTSSLLSEIAPITFEGEEFKTFKNYSQYLSEIYGDYMTLPPEEKRTGHEGDLGDIIIDLHTDYRHYK